jgi:hypothetical protein
MSTENNAAPTAHDDRTDNQTETVADLHVSDLVEHDEIRELFAMTVKHGIDTHVMQDLEVALVNAGYPTAGHDLAYRDLLHRGAGYMIAEVDRLADEVEACEEVIAKLLRSLDDARSRRDDLDDEYYELSEATGHHPMKAKWLGAEPTEE